MRIKKLVIKHPTPRRVMKEKKSGMKSPIMPKEHSERNEGQLNRPCGRKYAPNDSMGNPESLDKMNNGLSDYVKKNKMKYE